MTFKDYIDELRDMGYELFFEYNHEALYLTVTLTNCGHVVRCVLDYHLLSDEAAMIREIQKSLGEAK